MRGMRYVEVSQKELKFLDKNLVILPRLFPPPFVRVLVVRHTQYGGCLLSLFVR